MTEQEAGVPLVIAAHGTRDPEGQAVARAFIERVQRRLAPTKVTAGFVELMEPEIPDAISEALAGVEASGDVDAVVVPLLLATGGHIQDDIPEAIAEAGDGFEVVYARTLLPDPRILAALGQRITEALADDWRARDTAVVLVGRGNKTTAANALHYELTRTLWEQLDLGWAEPAFIQVTRPSLPDALNAAVAAGQQQIVVAQNFLFPGLLRNWVNDQVTAWQASHPEVQVRIAEVIGDSDVLADIVIDRYHEALGNEGVGQGAPAYLTGLLLRDRDVLVVGAGAVAARRIPKLLAAGAKVRVVAPNAGPKLTKLARAGEIDWQQRAFEASDIGEAWFVLAAANDPNVNAAVVEAAEAAHTFVVRSDSARLGSAFTPATDEAGGLTVAVVGNRDPQRSVRVRDALLSALQG